MEGEWHTLSSIEEALNLLREYEETNSLTKFSSIFEGVRGV